MNPDSQTAPRRTLLEILFVVFLRIIGLSSFWFGLQYWAMLTGYSLNGAGRFDLLNLPWQVAATGLAVIFPVAALGLWLAVSWGPVIWVFGAGGQMLMYLVWPDYFGRNLLVVAMHGMVAFVYMALRIAIWAQKRRRRALGVTVDLP